MKRASRMALCALVALAATSVGGAASARDGQAGHHDTHHGRHHHAGHHHAGLGYDGSGRVLVALGRLDRRLAGALRHRLTSLSAEDRVALRSNQASDQTAVETVATAYSQAPTGRHLHSALELLRGYRPERYVRAAAILSRGGRTAAAITDLSPLVAPESADAADLATASQLLTAAQDHHFTARTEQADMREARQQVAAAGALVDRVRADLSAAG
jgi:hypothetical protein